jgi:hypothetical protein
MVKDKHSVNIHRKNLQRKNIICLKESLEKENNLSLSPSMCATQAEKISIHDSTTYLRLGGRMPSRPHSLIGKLGVQQSVRHKTKAQNK